MGDYSASFWVTEVNRYTKMMLKVSSFTWYQSRGQEIFGLEVTAVSVNSVFEKKQVFL